MKTLCGILDVCLATLRPELFVAEGPWRGVGAEIVRTSIRIAKAVCPSFMFRRGILRKGAVLAAVCPGSAACRSAAATFIVNAKRYGLPQVCAYRSNADSHMALSMTSRAVRPSHAVIPERVAIPIA